MFDASASAACNAAAIDSIVGSAVSRFEEIALSASWVLFSKLFVTVSMPAEAISIGTRLGCGVYIKASPTSCSRSSSAYERLVGSREDLHRCTLPDGDPSAALHRADAVQLPAGERTFAQGARQREHRELEHVARGMRLGACVEEQPSGPTLRKHFFRERADGRDRVLECCGVASPASASDANTPIRWARK